MFTDNPRALKVFLIALAAVVGLTFAPAAIPAAASAAVHWLLYGVMFESIRRGAFSNIWHATKFTFKEIGRYLRDVYQERKNRKAFPNNQNQPPAALPPGGGNAPAAPVIPAANPAPVAPGVPAGTAAPVALATLAVLAGPAAPSTLDVPTPAPAALIQKAEAQVAEAEVLEREAVREEQKAEAEGAKEQSLRETEQKLEEELAVAEEQAAVPPDQIPAQTRSPESLMTAPQPVSDEVLAQRAEEEVSRVREVVTKQETKLAQLVAEKQKLEDIRRAVPEVAKTKEWKDAYRRVSTHIGIMEKRSLPRIRRIAGEDPVAAVAALHQRIEDLRTQMKGSQGRQKAQARQELAEARKDLSFVMRSAHAVNLEEISFVVDAVTSVTPEDIGRLDDPNVAEGLAVSSEGAARGIRFLAGLKRTQRLAAIKAAIAQIKVENAILKGLVAAKRAGRPVEALTQAWDAAAASIPDNVGGIRFREEDLMIRIRVDGEGLPLPVRFQDPALLDIQGLVPVIRSVRPLGPDLMPEIFHALQDPYSLN
ncbi:MAG: hypothetical protein GX606_02345 [Elusimicrobia bacterium]|nr:hypothetical protein [Elusimicrobiota bacterium]